MADGKIYFTPIEIETICKNGSERLGANALCYFSNDPEGRFFLVSYHGATKAEAKTKLINFLSGNGTVIIEEVKGKDTSSKSSTLI